MLRKLKFSQHIFKKNPEISNSLNIRPEGDDFFRVDWVTDRHDVAKSHFSQFWERA